MSLLGKALVFVLQTAAKPTLEKIGEHVGDAIGTRIGKKIDPDHGKAPAEDDKEKAKP